MTEEAMALIRKQKRRQRMRRLRQENGGKTRAEYLSASLTQTKPWLALGISRSTWERRRRRDASACPINLTKAEHGPASAGKCEVSKEVSQEVCDRLPTPTPAGQTQTYADPWAEEAEWMASWADADSYQEQRAA